MCAYTPPWGCKGSLPLLKRAVHHTLTSENDYFPKRKEGLVIARPSKSVNNLTRHSTKAEIAQRTAAEQAAVTGIRMRESAEVKANPTAHKEWARVKKLMAAVSKDDAIFEAQINDYCHYKAEIERYTLMKQQLENDNSVTGSKRYELTLSMDKQIEAFRKKRFDIEKENGFTVASALRSIPKKADKQANPLLSALGGISKD